MPEESKTPQIPVLDLALPTNIITPKVPTLLKVPILLGHHIKDDVPKRRTTEPERLPKHIQQPPVEPNVFIEILSFSKFVPAWQIDKPPRLILLMVN